MEAHTEDTLALLLLLNKRGIKLYLHEGELRFRARQGVVTPELRDTLRAQREMLTELLQSVRYDANCLVTIRGGQPGRIPLFCPHTLHGGVFDYRDLAVGLEESQPLYAFQGLSFLCGEEPRTSVEEMAAYYAQQLTAVWPAGPVVLYGASAGGLIALEMARALSERGRDIAFVALGDTVHPDYYANIQTETKERLHWIGFAEAYLPSETLEIDSRDHAFWQMDEAGRIEFLVQAASRSTRPGRLGHVDHNAIASHYRAFRSFKEAVYGYQIRPFQHRLCFFRAEASKPPRYESTIKAAQGEVQIITIPYGHLEMVRGPGAHAVGTELQRLINGLDQQGAQLE